MNYGDNDEDVSAMNSSDGEDKDLNDRIVIEDPKIMNTDTERAKN